MPEAFHRDFSPPATTTLPEENRSSGGCPNNRQCPSGRSSRWFPLLGAALGFVFIMLFIASGGRDVDANATVPHEEWLPAALVPAADEPLLHELTTKVERGDNTLAALARLNFDAATSYQIIHAAKQTYALKEIHAGRSFQRIDNRLGTTLYYSIDAINRLSLHRPQGAEEWQASLEQRQTHSRQRIAAGIIHDNLFLAASQAGLDQRTTMNLIDIFAWDVDFARDIRDGDSFRVLYEERFSDDGKLLESNILAAEFTNQGKSFRAVRYEQADGQVHYYNPEGKSMRKAYLKAPLKFSRISSRFSTKRKHPVLGYTRAHRGIDYAAASGTPIHAIGDGHIAEIGWKGGYGRFILIRHNNREHTTAYGHMRRYGRGMAKGKRVSQGDVIGYVGTSGLSTGPHLHFEFRVRNRAVNPLTIKLPPAEPIAKAEQARFFEQTTPLLTQLEKQAIELNWG